LASNSQSHKTPKNAVCTILDQGTLMYWKTFDWKSQKVGQKGEVLYKTSYRCGFCKGTGLMPSRKSTRCPACLGAGTVKVSSPAVICAYCSGAGRSPLNRDLTCLICKGKGVISVSSKDIESCPACKSKGMEKGAALPCLICKGKGVVPKKIIV